MQNIFSFHRSLANQHFFPVIFLTTLILFYLYLRDEPLSIRNFYLVFLSASIVFKKFRFFRLRRREPVQWFIGDEESPITIAAGGIDAKEGLELYPNGDSYEGELHLGKCSGSGVYDFFKHGKYEGDWVDGKYDGYGIERCAQGSQYHGHYYQGLRHGFGVYKYYKGGYYAGEWVSGRSHGRGVESCSDGSYYVGEFKSGVKHGSGFYQFRYGDNFAGEYFGGMIHGFGVYHFANGDCYEGSWHEGRQQGFGTYTFGEGEILSGEWNYGTLKNPLPPSHPKVQRFVQSGRNAAESAIHLPNVEEEINKAVAAAIRAATVARVAAIRAVRR